MIPTFTIFLRISLLAWFFFVPQPLRAATSPCEVKGAPASFPPIRLETIVTKLEKPLGLTYADDGSGRLFLVEQGGMILILKNGRLLERPYLDIRDRVISGGEKGLLGLAFHPNFLKDHRLFVNYTSSTGSLHTVISEFTVDIHPNEVDPKTERILLTVPQPYPNHKGGNLVFGPDGFLYIGMGDGGSANDPLGNGQNLATLLGKMLRIDVDKKEKNKAYGIPRDNPFVGQKNAAPEIWALGLRNPWRYAFDPVTGLLYVADVGQDDREEIDIVQKGKNYGWNIMEGMICAPRVNPNCNKTGLELPILEYSHAEGAAIIGGFVYRGHMVPNLCGVYVYGDYGNGRIWALRYDGNAVIEHRLLLETHRRISSFGEDEQHELYVVDLDGEVLKIVPQGYP